jgi:hypothetical protein
MSAEVVGMSENCTNCKTCNFYHGKDGLNCAPYPYGSEQDFCPDWQPKHSEAIVMNNLIVDKIKKVLLTNYSPDLIYLARRRPDSAPIEIVDSNDSFLVIVVVPNHRNWLKKLENQYEYESSDEATQLLKTLLNCQQAEVMFLAQRDSLIIPDIDEAAILVYRKRIRLSVLLEKPYLFAVIWFFLTQLVVLFLFGGISLHTILGGLIGASLGAIIGRHISIED